MLDLKLLQKNPEVVTDSLKRRNSQINMADFEALDLQRRTLLGKVEALKAERNKASEEVAKVKRAGGDASELIKTISSLPEQISILDAQLAAIKVAQEEWMLAIPNIPDSSVPTGKDETENLEVRRHGMQPVFNFTPKEHWELGQGYLDFERGAKLTGSRFTVSWRWAARLERALVNFYLDIHNTEGRVEILPPFIVNSKTMRGTGQLPKFAEDLFKLADWDYYLIPTAEVPLTNMHSDEILEESQLPLRYCAATPCFRSEAGAAGKDTRGLIRQHQFTKVEMVYFAHPDNSYACLEEMRTTAEQMLEKLELPYRTIVLCTGDMGFASAKTYDLEVWLPGQKAYREISSCSNCTDFQSRRANLRYRTANGKTDFVHTLNGSGLPTGRSLVAILENNQQADGSIMIPKALVPYMGGLEVIEP